MSTDLTITSASLPERMDYARAMAASNLLPQAFRGNPANALVAIEYGNALGIAPIVALSEINVISGTPSLSASLMAALARQAGHKVRVTGTDESATCVIVRGDDPDHEHTATWTKKKAQDANLWGKGHWSKDPGTMLRWRAISECVRFACSEVLGGLRYTPEEVREFTGEVQHVDSTVIVDRPPHRSGSARLADAVQAHPAAPSAPSPAEPAPVDVTDAEVLPDEPPADLITPAQMRKMRALMKDSGLTDPDEARAYAGAQVGREDLDSSKNLTKDEAGKVIDALEQLLASAPAVDDREPADETLNWGEQQ